MQYLNDPERLMKLLTQLCGGFGTTLSIFGMTLLISLPLGLLVALGRMSKCRLISAPVSFFILIMRGTPLMLQLFAVYFFLPKLLGPIPRLNAVYIAFGLNYAAYFAEIYRSGIQSIPRGQYEAAEVLGYTRGQTFVRIVLPQVVKRILPAVGNEVITLVKDTSLAFSIGVAEMFTESRALVASQRNMVPFAIAAAIYWVTCLLIEFVLRRVERKLDYYHD